MTPIFPGVAEAAGAAPCARTTDVLNKHAAANTAVLINLEFTIFLLVAG
jgi:hypothetical protein